MGDGEMMTRLKRRKLTPTLIDSPRRRRRVADWRGVAYVDGAYIQGQRGRWCYLYRAIDRSAPLSTSG